MPYSVDLKKRAVELVKQGHPIVATAKLFGVSRGSLHRWLKQEDLTPITVKRRKRKLNWSELEQDVIAHPEARLVDRARKFGVTVNAIWYALKEMKIKRKKVSGVRSGIQKKG
jgi:transposase